MELDRRAIVLGAEVANKEQAIEAVGQVLVRCGSIEAAYVASMARREQVANTFLGNGIAIPHGLPEQRDLINKTQIAILQVPGGVQWNPGETAFLVVGIAARSDEHIQVLGNLTRLLDDPDTIARLAQTNDPDEIVTAFAGQTAQEEAAELDLTGTVSTTVTIEGEHGLHARPATFLVDVAKQFTSEVFLVTDSGHANGKSLASLLKLGVGRGQTVTLHVRGADAKEALAALAAAVTTGLGEEEEEVVAPISVHGWRPRNVGRTIDGIKASPGLAIGPLHQFIHEEIVVETTGDTPERERRILKQALAAARENLQQLYAEVRTKTGAGKAAIFKAHQAFLDDPELQGAVFDLIDAGRSAGFAWRQVIEERVQALERHDDPVLAGRAMDLRDVGRRVLRQVVGAVADAPVLPQEPVILVAQDLTPSDTASLDPTRILGLCTAGGGPTSHTAIIARSLGIPAMVAAGPALLTLANGSQAILDGDTGALYLDASEEDRNQAIRVRQELGVLRDIEYQTRFQPALTKDGHRIEVVANIGKAEEAKQAVSAGAEGVGLLRTEFLFLGRATPPDEEEQYSQYRAMLQTLNGLPLIIRTLDIGGDKEVEYLDLPAEDNPFLGERGIRLCLKRPELFLTQLRAIYRASQHGPLRIMFPMVAALQELREAKRLAEQARQEVGAEAVELGIMVEVPSVAVMADSFAEEVDFFSIGTNDLTQYLLAIDRLHPTLASQADSLHPAVLRMIDQVVRAADKAGIWVGVCGGLAGEPRGAVILAGMGVRELSMVVPSIPAIKAWLRSLEMREAREVARAALSCRTPEEVHALPLP